MWNTSDSVANEPRQKRWITIQKCDGVYTKELEFIFQLAHSGETIWANTICCIILLKIRSSQPPPQKKNKKQKKTPNIN